MKLPDRRVDAPDHRPSVMAFNFNLNMLTDAELQKYCLRLNLAASAVKYIERARAAGPSRKVRCGSNNVIAHYPSQKMNRMVPAESHTVELAFIQQMEHDDAVLEFHAQPLAIKIQYTAASGRQIGVIHTPDFLILMQEGAGWVECKTEERLRELATTQPNRYRTDGQSGWICPPGEAAARPLGLFYQVWSSARLNPTLVRNLRFLEDYLCPDYPDLPEPFKKDLVERVRRTPGVTAQSLVENCCGSSYEHVFTLIGKGTVYVDLKEFSLTQLDRVRVYPDEQTALARRFAHLSQGHRKTPVGLLNVRPEIPPPQPVPSLAAQVPMLTEAAEQALQVVDASEMEVANRRFQILQAGPSHRPANISRRTLRRWACLYRHAELRWGCGYVGLLPRIKDRGNKSPRFPEDLLKLADQVIDEHFQNRKGRTRVATYGVFQVECEKLGMLVPSYPWFTKRIQERTSVRTAEIRDARFGPLRTEERLAVDGTQTHGDRPWDVVHIDHTLCDIELVDDQTGMNLGRPWISIAFDAYSRRVLAFHLTFDRPSYKSCLMAMRECVRRHGRLPSCAIVDGGPEFKHVYFETFCARYRIILKIRPGARPYFGSVIERMFGTIGTQFFQNLAGNTHVLKTATRVIASVHPKKDAVWTLEALHDLLSEYCYELYDNRVHPSLNMPPARAFDRGMDIGGVRESRHVAYDEDLIAMTLPTTRSGVATVQRGMGVKINYLYYWSNEMRNSQFLRSKVAVRYDPWNLAVAYAYLGDRWVKCISSHAEAFRGRSEKELMLATAKLIKSGSNARQSQFANAKKLAAFFMSVEGEEKLRKQRLKDMALRRTQEVKRPNDQSSLINYDI